VFLLVYQKNNIYKFKPIASSGYTIFLLVPGKIKPVSPEIKLLEEIGHSLIMIYFFYNILFIIL
jgi:hypothetical protein